ncbi:MarR family winged helix-turn-helix transcriptional regulator [Kutzneria sp. NPDC052558]|uniref:MarR family winged helix-turn-helix transcriptional regulator n=1 Tax=Kutzneria sp. NPDC052558 TaxID=3364121 RepID=UPI0037C5B184
MEADLSATAADLRLAVKLLAQRLRAEARPGELSWSQESVVSLLDRLGPTTVTELARIEGVRSQSMGATVASLEELGLVGREPDPRDGRQSIVSLTGQGVSALGAARAVKQSWLVGVLGERLSVKEQRELGAAIQLLLRLV